MLQFMHAQKSAVAGAFQIFGAYPATHHIFTAGLEPDAGKQAGVVPGISTDAQGILSALNKFLSGFNRMIEIGVATTVGTDSPISRQLIIADFLKRSVG